MTTYQPKEGSGSLFKNDKGDNPNRPDYRGDICIEGVVYSLSAWIKEGREGTRMEGKKFMSLSATPKPATQPAAYADAPTPAPAPAPAPRRQTHAEQDARAIAERRERAAAPKPASGTGFDSMEDDIPF